MSTKVSISVDVPVGKELVVKENTPETKVGKKLIPASSKTLCSFKKGKGNITWTINGPNYLTFEENEHNDH